MVSQFKPGFTYFLNGPTNPIKFIDQPINILIPTKTKTNISHSTKCEKSTKCENISDMPGMPDMTDMTEFIEPAELLLSLSEYKYQNELYSIDSDDVYSDSDNYSDTENHNHNHNKNGVYSKLLGKRIYPSYPSYQTNKTNTAKTTNTENTTKTSRPIRTVRSTYSSSPITMISDSNDEEYVEKPNKKNRSRYSNALVRGDRVRILKNLNDYKYYDYQGVITDAGNGFYSVDIDDIDENAKFRSYELEIV